MTKKCPRCGGGKIYDSWFHQKERCPTCGFQFEREDGFFFGSYLINFAIAEGALFVVIMGFVAWKVNNPDAGVLGFLIGTIVLAVVGPMLMYPFARTIWSAIDLGMTPLSPAEEAAAIQALALEGKTWGDAKAELPPADGPEGPPDQTTPNADA